MSLSVGTLVISLPIADRRRAMAFYRDAFGFDPVGEPAEDGVPEPLQYQLNDRTLLMLIPTGGFGWVLGDRAVAPTGVSECILSTTVATEREVIEVIERVRRCGGDVVTEPSPQPWGYSGLCADLDGHVWQVTVELSTSS
ncbi:VOC family protein [Micromonospora sp. NPDC003197]